MLSCLPAMASLPSAGLDQNIAQNATAGHRNPKRQRGRNLLEVRHLLLRPSLTLRVSISMLNIPIKAHSAPSRLTHMRKTTDYFSSTYAEARDRFHEAAGSAGAVLEDLPVDGRGPIGEPLSISVARLGSPTASHVLLHTSGIHGVEGFVGSALQLQLLAEPPEIPPDGAIVIAHVINPYGMAWLRRMNENNVDLNRNLLPEWQFSGASPTYERLSRLLNFEGPPRRFDAFHLRGAWFVLRHGIKQPRQAVGEGQYQFPRGLFYGGQRREQEPRLVLDWVHQNLALAQRTVAVDVHSGLGPYGVDSLLVHCAPASDQGRQLVNVFGDQVKFDQEAEVAYRVRGGFLAELENALPQSRMCTMTQEFGTYGVAKMLKVLRDENLYHHYTASPQTAHPTKQSLMKAFCPDDRAWRQSVLACGRRLLVKTRQFFSERSLQSV